MSNDAFDFDWRPTKQMELQNRHFQIGFVAPLNPEADFPIYAAFQEVGAKAPTLYYPVFAEAGDRIERFMLMELEGGTIVDADSLPEGFQQIMIPLVKEAAKQQAEEKMVKDLAGDIAELEEELRAVAPPPTYQSPHFKRTQSPLEEDEVELWAAMLEEGTIFDEEVVRLAQEHFKTEASRHAAYGRERDRDKALDRLNVYDEAQDDLVSGMFSAREQARRDSGDKGNDGQSR